MMKLCEVMEQKGMSVADVARLTGKSKSVISLVKNGKYPKQDEAESEILSLLAKDGYVEQESEFRRLRVARDVFVKTENVKRFDALADELIDPEGDLTSSIGVVVGRAGRGKTFAARRYAVQNLDAAYTLFIDGFSLVTLAREIAYELTGAKPRFFAECIDAIAESTITKRRLVIIDEADKMPKKHFEMVRALNERCAVPVVLVGEENIKKIIDSERRLKSRVRDIVPFEPISVVDIAVYYKQAVGISNIEGEILKTLWKRSGGDFRFVVKDAFAIVRILNASRIDAITPAVIKMLDGKTR
jgi:DNA transposition AAA+ family ATPase